MYNQAERVREMTKRLLILIMALLLVCASCLADEQVVVDSFKVHVQGNAFPKEWGWFFLLVVTRIFISKVGFYLSVYEHCRWQEGFRSG